MENKKEQTTLEAYRLKQMYDDGQSGYSKDVSAEMKTTDNGIHLFPNPAPMVFEVTLALETDYKGEATLPCMTFLKIK